MTLRKPYPTRPAPGSPVPAGHPAALPAWISRHRGLLLETIRPESRGYIGNLSGSMRDRRASREPGRDIVYRELAKSMTAGGMGLPQFGSSARTPFGAEIPSGGRAAITRPAVTTVDRDAQRVLERARVRRVQQALTYTNRWR